MGDSGRRATQGGALRRFIIGVLIASLAAVPLGALLHSFIKGVLFNVWIVCTMLIVGGGPCSWIDRLRLKLVYHDATQFPLMTLLIIGSASASR